LTEIVVPELVAAIRSRDPLVLETLGALETLCAQFSQTTGLANDASFFSMSYYDYSQYEGRWKNVMSEEVDLFLSRYRHLPSSFNRPFLHPNPPPL